MHEELYIVHNIKYFSFCFSILLEHTLSELCVLEIVCNETVLQMCQKFVWFETDALLRFRKMQCRMVNTSILADKIFRILL